MSPFTPRNWTDGSAPALSAANIEDLETRTTDYADALELQHIYNVKSFGAVGDDTADDTAAIQDAINAAKLNGGTVFLPKGIYKITSTLDLSNSTLAFAMKGAAPGNHAGGDNKGRVSVLSYTPATGSLLNCNSCHGLEVSHLFLQYEHATYSGDLVSVDGTPLGSDCIDFHFHHLGSRGVASATARSIIRLNQAIIGRIDMCHFTCAVNCLRVGDPGGLYVVSVSIADCTFNSSSDAHILLGTADGESLQIERCTFEAGTDTPGIRGASVAVDGANNTLYNPVIRDCWFGDSGAATNWIEGPLKGPDAGYTGLLSGCRFASNQGGVHVDLLGSWVVMNNSFENGTVFGRGFSAILIHNSFANVTSVWASNQRPGYGGYGSYVSLNSGGAPASWNAGETNHMGRLGLGFRGGVGSGDGVGDGGPTDGSEQLVLGVSASGYQEIGARAAVYADEAGSGNQNANALVLSSPTDTDNREVQLVAGDTPAAKVRASGVGLGFYGTAPQVKPEITGSRGGNVALTDLLTSLAGLGLITDSTSA